MIRPWIFEFFPEAASPAEAGRCIDQYLDLWTRDEALGFEGIFFSEHHFGGSYAPSPNLLIAALASRTQRLRLGVMGIVTPYYHPTRIIEEFGLLDQLTRGRLEIGTAVGVPQELALLGMSMGAAREINDEILEIVDQALAGGPVTHHGKHFSFGPLRLLPPLRQLPAPPRWTTVVSVESARKAARRRSKICTGFISAKEIAALFDAYRDEAARTGFDVDANWLAIRRRVTISESFADADEARQRMAARYRAFVASDPRMQTNASPDSPRKEEGFNVSSDEFISGTPVDVHNAIRAQCEAAGAGHFLAVLHWGAQFDEVAAAHELFGAKVIPALASSG